MHFNLKANFFPGQEKNLTTSRHEKINTRGISGTHLKLCNIKGGGIKMLGGEGYTNLKTQMERGETGGEQPGLKTFLKVKGWPIQDLQMQI